MNKKIFYLAEKTFILFSLWFFTGNPIDLLLFGGGGGEEYQGETSNFLEPVIYLSICITATALLGLRWRKSLTQIIKRDKTIWLVSLIVLISTNWSAYPDITMRRGLILFMSTCFGAYFATRYSYQEQLKYLRLTFISVIAMSFFFIFFLPKYGVMGGVHSGAWRGVYMHKNSLGIQMSLISSFFLLKTFGINRPKWLHISVLASSLVLLFFSRSSTALMAFLALAAITPAFNLAKLGYRLAVPCFALILLFIGGSAIFFATNAEQLVAFFGRDLTLTGRTDLWPYVWHMINKKPWFGYGYEAFWRGPTSESSLIWRITGWTPPHAHNGLLELLLIFGWVGTLIFLFGFLVALFKSFAFVNQNRSPESFWPVIFLFFLVLTNITEKNILGGGISWSIYVSTSMLLPKEKIY